jgi:hypothetical protein
MKIRTAFVAVALSLAPVSAIAMEGCGLGHMKTETTASVCVEGQTFNEALGVCVPTASS